MILYVFPVDMFLLSVQDQYFLYGLPGGMFLLLVGWWRPAAETSQIYPDVLGLFDWLQRVCHHHEEYPVGKMHHQS